MTKKTKKVGITGKYGTRYGSALRKIIKKFEVSQHSKFFCPATGKNSLKREACGIWRCSQTGMAFAGGAYELSTAASIAAKQGMLRIKKIKEEAMAEQTQEKKKPEEKKQKKGGDQKNQQKDKPKKK